MWGVTSPTWLETLRIWQWETMEYDVIAVFSVLMLLGDVSRSK
jgi:hypothetical protein